MISFFGFVEVTLIISGARGPPPPSFADLADTVQQEFDSWWAQELQEQSPKEVPKPDSILASNSIGNSLVIQILLLFIFSIVFIVGIHCE